MDEIKAAREAKRKHDAAAVEKFLAEKKAKRESKEALEAAVAARLHHAALLRAAERAIADARELKR